MLSARPSLLIHPLQPQLRAVDSFSCRPSHLTVASDSLRMPLLNILLWSFYLLPLQHAHAQSISTSTPVPPLQWINLTSLLQGPSPPPLKDASIGFDNTSRTLVVFGGESQGGLPQQQTYLSVLPFLTFFRLALTFHRFLSSLNLDTLTWTTPSPQGGTSSASPPPRSAAIGGGDFAAS